MKKINQDALANIHFELKRDSSRATHTDCYEAIGVNTWRDFIPSSLLVALEGKSAGEKITINFGPGTIIPEYDSRKRFSIKEKQFVQFQLNTLFTLKKFFMSLVESCSQTVCWSLHFQTAGFRPR